MAIVNAISAPDDNCSAGKAHTPTLTVDAARLRAVAATRVIVDTETINLFDAQNRVTASPIVARSSLPPFDNSAMDGYAVATASLTGDGPWRLPVSGRIIAGDSRHHTLLPNTAQSIFTGAPIPENADAIIMQENVLRDGAEIVVTARPKPGMNIRLMGEDCAQGSVALSAGLILTPPRLALLAGTGIETVTVKKRLRVGLFSTGNELREPGQTLAHGQIYNSNRVLLRAMLNKPWIVINDYGIVRDEPNLIQQTLCHAALENDVIISSGGVSAGEEDHVLDALQRVKADLQVLKIAIRPGKPLTVGRIGDALYFGLPGNPYAAAITFTQIAQPALRKAAGITETPDNWLSGVADFTYSRKSGRTEFVPVMWTERDALGRPKLQRLGVGASASLTPVALAMGIAALPANFDAIHPGMPLTVEPIGEA